MLNFIKKFFKNLQEKRKKQKLQKLYKKRLEELKKRDPFVYRH